MFVHIGKEMIIDSNQFIAVLDYQKAKNGGLGSDELRREVVWIDRGGQLLKSIIVTDNGWYLSTFSCETIKKRTHVGIGRPIF